MTVIGRRKFLRFLGYTTLLLLIYLFLISSTPTVPIIFNFQKSKILRNSNSKDNIINFDQLQLQENEIDNKVQDKIIENQENEKVQLEVHKVIAPQEAFEAQLSVESNEKIINDDFNDSNQQIKPDINTTPKKEQQQEQNDNIHKLLYAQPNYPEVYNSDVVEIRKVITEINFANQIFNEHILKNAFAEKDGAGKPTLLLIQVHNRADFFEILLHSLSQMEGIEECLVIISSDIYDKQINDLVV